MNKIRTREALFMHKIRDFIKDLKKLTLMVGDHPKSD